MLNTYTLIGVFFIYLFKTIQNMAAVPPCGLGCRLQKAYEYLKIQKKPFLLYSIFYLLVIELLSFMIRDWKNYACFWYPLLTQIGYAVLLFSIFLWGERLHFCVRKNITVVGLFLYYFTGSVSLIFGVSNNTYIEIAMLVLFLISMISILLTIFKRE